MLQKFLILNIFSSSLKQILLNEIKRSIFDVSLLQHGLNLLIDILVAGPLLSPPPPYCAFTPPPSPTAPFDNFIIDREIRWMGVGGRGVVKSTNMFTKTNFVLVMFLLIV